MEQTLGKSKRIKSSKRIAEIINTGQKIKAFPLLVFYIISDNEPHNISAAFTVSKKKFKRAVDRNRIKRLMREAHRIHQSVFADEKKPYRLELVYIYIGQQVPKFDLVNSKSKEIFTKLVS